MTYFGRTAVIVRHLRKATNVPLEESGTFPKKISASQPSHIDDPSVVAPTPDKRKPPPSTGGGRGAGRVHSTIVMGA